MRKSIALAVIMAAGLATPAHAVGLGDLAKVVLGNGAVLKKSNDTCQTNTGQTKQGSSALLGAEDLLALAFAREAAQKALPAPQFLSLDNAANTSATKAAQSPTFCTNTAQKKNVLLDAVKKAGQKLITARVLGL